MRRQAPGDLEIPPTEPSGRSFGSFLAGEELTAIRADFSPIPAHVADGVGHRPLGTQTNLESCFPPVVNCGESFYRSKRNRYPSTALRIPDRSEVMNRFALR